jgi:hypothetical protein
MCGGTNPRERQIKHKVENPLRLMLFRNPKPLENQNAAGLTGGASIVEASLAQLNG